MGLQLLDLGVGDGADSAGLQQRAEARESLRGRRALGGGNAFEVAVDGGHAALPIELGLADDPVGGGAGPADDEEPLLDRAAGWVVDLIGLIARVEGIRVGIPDILRSGAGEAELLVDPVADREDDGVARDVDEGPGALGGKARPAFDEDRLLDPQRLDLSGTVEHHLGRGAEEAETEPGRALPLLRLDAAVAGQFGGRPGKVLADGLEGGAHPFQLCPQVVLIEVGGDRLDLDVGVGALRGAPAGDSDHLADLLLVDQPVGEVDHDIANPDDRHPLPDAEVPPAELGQSVVVVDEIFRVIDAFGVISRDPEGLGPLRPGGDDDRRGGEQLLDLRERQVGRLSDLDVAVIMDPRIDEDLAELLADPLLQFVLVEVDPVLDEAAGLDVAVEDDHFVPRLRQFSYAVDAGRAGANGHNEMSAPFQFFRHIDRPWLKRSRALGGATCRLEKMGCLPDRLESLREPEADEDRPGVDQSLPHAQVDLDTVLPRTIRQAQGIVEENFVVTDVDQRGGESVKLAVERGDERIA